jgi:uncharacterized surface anchored protein
VTADVVTPVTTSSLSGYVYADNSGSGEFESGEGLFGAAVTLTGTNDLGQAVNLTAYTDNNGYYSFGDLQPGTYSLSETLPALYQNEVANVGSAGGTAGTGQITGITLGSGTNGVNYNFATFLNIGA